MTREEAKELIRNDKDSFGKPRAIMTKLDKIYDSLESDSFHLERTTMNQEQLELLAEDTVQLMIHNDMHEAAQLIEYLASKYNLVVPTIMEKWL